MLCIYKNIVVWYQGGREKLSQAFLFKDTLGSNPKLMI